MRAQGAKLVEFGEITSPRSNTPETRRRPGHITWCSLSPRYLLGVATYWLELFTAVPEIDVAYVPVGMARESVPPAAVATRWV